MNQNNRYTNDYYQQQAKREGYAARSVYKLIAIQNKYHLIKRAHTIVDIGAAPGSWTQYCSQLVGERGRVIAVDMRRLNITPPRRNITFLQGDVFSESIKRTIRDSVYNGIISDAAPNTTGNSVVDSAASLHIVSEIITLFVAHILPKGYILLKIFESQQSHQMRHLLQRYFETVVVQRPRAVRSHSMECYLIGMNKQAHPSISHAST